MNDKKNKKDFTPTKKALKTISNYSPDTDPQGSYTGKPANVKETPVQDADDL